MPSPTRWLLVRGANYTAVTAAQALALVLTLPVLTRLLTASQMGVVAAALIIYRLVALLAGIGLPAAVGREYFEEDGPKRAGVLAAWCIGLVVVVGIAVELSGPAWASMFGAVPYAQALRLSVWAGAATGIARTGLSYLRAADQARRFVVVSLMGGPGAHIAGLLYLALIRPEPEAFLWGFLGATTLSALLALTWIPLQRPRLDQASRVYAGLRYGFPTVPHLGAMMVIVLGDRVLVERFLGVDELGRYEVAYVLGAVGIQLLLAVGNAWTPLILGEPPSRMWATLGDTTELVHRVARLVGAGLAIGAPIGLQLLAPDSYSPLQLGPVVAVVAGTIPFYVWYVASSIVLQQRRRMATFYWAAPLAAVFNIVLNVLLLPILGLVGAALATVLAYGLLGAITARGAARLVDDPWHSHGLFTSILVVGVAILGSIIAPSSPGWLWLRGLVGGLLLVQIARTIQSAARSPIKAEV